MLNDLLQADRGQPSQRAQKYRSNCGRRQGAPPLDAIRHGLTAETVIGALEDAEDYKSFEAAIIADYDVQSAVELELVLRLASLLWRLRRAATMETGLFEIQADQLRSSGRRAKFNQVQEIIYARCGGLILPISTRFEPSHGSHKRNGSCAQLWAEIRRSLPTSHVAFCVWPICPTYPLDRLSRYEAILWRQAGQILFALDAWIVANHKIEGAVSASAAGNTCRPTDATTIELPDPSIYAIEAELGRDGRAIGINRGFAAAPVAGFRRPIQPKRLSHLDQFY